MQNYINAGHTIEVTAEEAITAGRAVSIGTMAGIAISDIAQGDTGLVALSGAYMVAKFAGSSFAKGQRVYATPDGLATPDYTDALLGHAILEAGSGVAGVAVKLGSEANVAGVENPYKVIRLLDNLPAPVGGVITLPSNGDAYYFKNRVDLEGLTIVMGANTFLAHSQEDGGLVNGTVIFDMTAPVRFIRFGECNTVINSPLGAFDWTHVNFYDCPDFDVQNADNLILETVGFINSVMRLTGTINSLVVSPNVIWRSVTNPTARFFEITATGVLNRRSRIENGVMSTDFAGQTAIFVDPAASIGVESFIMKTVRFTGPGTFLDGINGDDDRAAFFEVFGGNAINSTAIANVFVKNNATPTPCPVVAAKYRVLGTTEVGPIIQKFAHAPSFGGVEYTSVVRRNMVIICTFSFTAPQNNVIGFYIGIKRNGNAQNPETDLIPESENYVTASGTRPDGHTVQCLATLEAGDLPYLIVENETATNAVTVGQFNMIIVKAPQ